MPHLCSAFISSVVDIRLLLQNLQQIIEDQAAVIAEQAKTIKRLEEKVTSLEAEVAILRNKKNSNNSSVPPSKDENRPKKNQSLRTKSGRRPGGQPGREGTTLTCNGVVDEVVKHSADFCSCCGKDMSGTEETLIATRQVIDIPPIRPATTAHQVYARQCSCGHKMQGSFPAHITAAVQYGPNVSAMVAYLHARQYLPYDRLRELIKDGLGLPLSIGGINNILQRIAQKATPVYQQIKQRISQASVIGADETGVNIAGKLHWMWVWQNDWLTYLHCSDTRGFKTIEAVFEGGLPKAVLQHDRYAPHFKTVARHHQVCTAHLLRDFNYIHELYDGKCIWPGEFKALIHQSLQLKKEMSAEDYTGHNRERQQLYGQLQYLLELPLEVAFKKAVSLQKKLRKIRGCILSFLEYPDVPPDNNGSERAIRNVKVKQKISGQYRSGAGADTFAILRSVIDTTIKSGQNVLNALFNIALCPG